MESKAGPVKVLLTQELAPNLLDDIRNVDPALEINILDREMVPLFWGRPAGDRRSLVQQRFASLMAEAEVLYGLILSTEQARNVLAAMPELRWFQSTSAGVDELIGAGYGERGVAVTTSSGVHATPIGEFALHLMLMFAKQGARSLTLTAGKALGALHARRAEGRHRRHRRAGAHRVGGRATGEGLRLPRAGGRTGQRDDARPGRRAAATVRTCRECSARAIMSFSPCRSPTRRATSSARRSCAP